MFYRDGEIYYRDRRDAGNFLADLLTRYYRQPDVLVLALPRGGVPVAYEIARKLHLPLDIFLVRKLGVPGHEELAMGAIASGGVRVLNYEVLRGLPINDETIEKVAKKELEELERRDCEYRGEKPHPQIEGKRIILVDDGLATGSTMRAAIEAIRKQQPKEIIIAVPVASREVCEEFRHEVDKVVCASMPEDFHAVGIWYEDFSQTPDAEVSELLRSATGKEFIP